MKKVEVEIDTDYGFAHYGGEKTDENESSVEISDALADYLRPMLEDGLDMRAVDELCSELQESNPALAEELSQLYYDIQDLCYDMTLEYCLEEDRDYYDDENLEEYREKDLKEGRFVPTFANIEAFYEAHKDNYEDIDDYEVEDDYDSAVKDEYMDWVEHLELYERAVRCFGEDMDPMNRIYDWDYRILGIS